MPKRYKIRSFPFLSPESKDYLSSVVFDCAADIHRKPGGKVVVEASYTLSNPRMIEDIKKGLVKAICRCSSPSTGIVKTQVFNPNHIAEIEFKKTDVDKEIVVEALLVANQNIYLDYPNVAAFWKGCPSFVQKGNIIGETEDVRLTIRHNLENGVKSIFSFVRDLNYKDGDPVRIDLSTDKIIFLLSGEKKEQYDLTQTNEPCLAIVSYLLPVFTQIFSQMKQQPNGEESEFTANYKGKMWYDVLRTKFWDAFGEEPEQSDCTPFEAAQKILGDAIKDLYDLNARKTGSFISKEEDGE